MRLPKLTRELTFAELDLIAGGALPRTVERNLDPQPAPNTELWKLDGPRQTNAELQKQYKDNDADAKDAWKDFESAKAERQAAQTDADRDTASAKQTEAANDYLDAAYQRGMAEDELLVRGEKPEEPETGETEEQNDEPEQEQPIRDYDENGQDVYTAQNDFTTEPTTDFAQNDFATEPTTDVAQNEGGGDVDVA